MPNITHTTHNSHAVILLASGLSQRLGTPKQLLTQHVQTLIEVMLRKAYATHPAVIIIVIPEGHLPIKRVIDEVVNDIKPIEIVFNKEPERGMGHSLRLGIDALNTQASHHSATTRFTTSNIAIEKVMILGVDQILLDTQHLNNLLKENTKVVASRYAKSDEIVRDNRFDGRDINEVNFNCRNLAKADLESGSKNNNYSIDIGLDSSETIVGLPIIIDYKLLKNWQSDIQGDKGLRYQIRALAADEVTTVDNLNLSLDIDTPEQLKFAKDKGWLDS